MVSTFGKENINKNIQTVVSIFLHLVNFYILIDLY